jgi:hypothetical protein
VKPNQFACVVAQTEIPKMRKILINSAMAIGMALTGMPLGASLASAQVELRIDRSGPELRLRDDCDPRYEDCRYGDRRYDDDRYYEVRREERGCTPDRALRKADRMGIRRARIIDVGRRTIDVAGRDRRGNRVVVEFGRRDRSCPVY